MVNRIWRLRALLCASLFAVLLVPVFGAPTASGVIAGTTAADGDWPWMVAVIENDLYVCGGVLLSAEAVITASHCFGDEPGVVEVQVGGVTLGSGRRISIEQVHHHPEADVAILDLGDPVDPSSQVFAINTAPAGSYQGGDIAWIAGWGAVDADEPIVVTGLHQAAVPLVSDEECSAIFPLQFQAPTEICAGGSGAGSCLGDSGGPLMVEVEDQWLLVGVVSRSALPCAAPGSPAIFTEVAPLATWIGDLLEPPVVVDKAPAPPPPDLEDQPIVEDPIAVDVVVMTGYSEKEFATLSRAAESLEMDPAAVQKAGVYVLRFLTILSGFTDPQPLAVFPDTSGTVGVPTSWSLSEIEALSWGVGHYGGSREQTQKIGVTLLSFLASIS